MAGGGGTSKPDESYVKLCQLDTDKSARGSENPKKNRERLMLMAPESKFRAC